MVMSDTPQPRRRLTTQERQLLIEECRDLMMTGAYRSQIKRDLGAKWGMAPRSLEKIMKSASAMLLERRRQDRETHQAESQAFYESILRDPKANRRTKLRAAELRDKLLGLREPARHELTGADGGPIKETVVFLDEDKFLNGDGDTGQVGTSAT